jgi:Zn-dependent protease
MADSFNIEQLLNGLLWYLTFIFSTTLHEASHAFVAMRLGDDTAYLGGHVTLDPLPHIRREPMGTVVVPIISYLAGGWMIGWASVPYSVEWSLMYPKRSALMSLAGPAANFTLVLLSALVIRMGIFFDVFYAPESISFMQIVAAHESGTYSVIASFASIFFSLNLLLFFFNLLPVPPLDGSGVVALFIPEEKARQYLKFIRKPSFMFIGLMLAWQFFGVIYSPIHLFFINLLYPESHYR